MVGKKCIIELNPCNGIKKLTKNFPPKTKNFCTYPEKPYDNEFPV